MDDNGDHDGSSSDPSDPAAWEDDQTFNAPPELVKDSRNRYGVMFPKPSGVGVSYWWGTDWRCSACGTTYQKPQEPGPGELTPPSACHSCDRKPDFQPAVNTENDHISPERVLEMMPEKFVYNPPTAEFGFEEDPTFAGVYEDIRSYIKQFWATGDGREWLYDMLSCYAISTWFRERWNFVPHLLIQGSHETGKSRLLNTLKNVSYRCVHNADLSSAYIYRGINNHNLTMFISEYHRLNDEEQQSVDAVINAGQKRGETIGRATEQSGGGYDIESFDPFAHIAVSTQYEPDDDLISRCFRITTKPARRSVPRQLRDRPDLRQRMLFLRYRWLRSDRIAAAEEQAVAKMDKEGVRDRLSEKMWCILTVGELADVDLSNVIEGEIDREQDRQRDTEESIFVQALIDEAFEQLTDGGADDEDNWSDLYLPIGSVKNRFDRLSDRSVSSSYIGQLRARLGLDKVRHSDGTKINDDELKDKLKRFAEENNVEWGASPGIVENHNTVEISLPSDDDDADEPTQEERRDTIFTVCKFLDDGDPLDKRSVIEMAADQCGADESTIKNELELLFSKDNRFDNTPEGELFDYLG